MHILLDNGHGGIIDGVYQTPGKRSPVWKDGRQLFEGDFNRIVVDRVHRLCETHGISSEILVPELEDISLSERVRRTNKIYQNRRDTVLISVHANAGGGTGLEVFTSVGATRSDQLAEIVIKSMVPALPELRLRKDTRDGDLDKESQFYILRRTHCPAMLVECAFMDTLEPDCRMLLEEPDRFADAIFDGIKNIVKA